MSQTSAFVRTAGLLSSVCFLLAAPALAQQVQLLKPGELNVITTTTTIDYKATNLNIVTTKKDLPTIKLETVIKVETPKQSGPVCGGLDAFGAPQQRCGAQHARFEAPAARVCPAGSFLDIGKWQCWSCPPGYDRTGVAVDADRACSKRDPSVRGEFGRATLIKNVACPAGTFWDGIRNGECWKCPGGFNRTWEHIDTDKACSQSWVGPFRRAEFVQKNHCEAGEIHDPRNGGECWKCPPGWDRTIGSVAQWDACEKGGGIAFQKATKMGDMGCPASQLFDFIDLTQQDLFDMRNRALAAGNQQEAARLAGLKPVAPADVTKLQFGGTCWSCPTGYDRTYAHVKAGDACRAKTMAWYTKPYDEPGLFGLAGADTVLLDITRRHPALVLNSIKQAAATIARSNNEPYAQVLAREKELFAASPEKSAAAAAIVSVRVFAAIVSPHKASAAELQLLESFKKYIVDRRTYIAKDALAAYDAWLAADRYWKAKDREGKTTMTTLFDYGSVPPDFSKIGLLGTLGSGVASMAVGHAVGSLPIIGDVLGLALGAAGNGFADFKDTGSAVKWGARAGTELVIGKMAEGAVQVMAKAAAHKLTQDAIALGLVNAAPKAAGRVLVTASSAGPGLIIGASMMVASIALDQVMEIELARPKLQTSLQKAGVAPDLARMATHEDGVTELETMWSYASAAETGPSQTFRTQFASLAPTAIADAACLPANAKSAEIDPKFYYRLSTQWQGDGKSLDVINDGKNNRVQLAGTANVSGQMWKILPLGGNLYRLTTAWQGEGKSLDIVNDGRSNTQPQLMNTANASGQHWKITTVGGGWNRLTTAWQGDCMMLDIVNDGANNKPVLSPGAIATGQFWKLTKTTTQVPGAQVASAAPTAVPAAAGSWARVPGAARDIAIGANGKVWHIGTDTQPGGYGIYRLDGNNWTKVPGGAVRIAVDPQGNAWVANDKRQIFRYDGRQFVTVPGLANDIGIGANGVVWHIGTDTRPGGFGIYRWDGKGWVNVPGAGVRVAVDARGNGAVVNDQGGIFSHDGSKWSQMPGSAKDIAIGAQGHVWVVGTNTVAGGFGVYRWDGKAWAGVPGGLTGIAVAPDGKLWGANSNREIFRMQ